LPELSAFISFSPLPPSAAAPAPRRKMLLFRARYALFMLMLFQVSAAFAHELPPDVYYYADATFDCLRRAQDVICRAKIFRWPLLTPDDFTSTPTVNDSLISPSHFRHYYAARDAANIRRADAHTFDVLCRFGYAIFLAGADAPQRGDAPVSFFFRSER
jgi:hypothetical protein